MISLVNTFGSGRSNSVRRNAMNNDWFNTDFFDELKNVFMGKGATTKKTAIPEAPIECKAKPVDSVLVIGATGKSGVEIVDELLMAGRNVVVAACNETKAMETFGPAYTKQWKDSLFIRLGVDVTNPDTLTAELYDGVSQLVSSIGPSFSNPLMTAEAVDYKGNINIIESMKKHSSSLLEAQESRNIVNFDQENREIDQWSRLDDVLMGGSSSSCWKSVSWGNEGGDFCRWGGQLVTTGGGFCGTVIKDIKFDVTGFDGISLRVRGDGNRYKFRLKPDSAESNRNEFQYQASFDTTAGCWTTVHLPFDSFVSVKRNNVDYSSPEVNKVTAASGRMASLGLVLSRFEFNERPNPRCTPGSFQLDVADIDLYRSTRPAVVMVSSAGTERINKLASPEERATDIPIVQLNPQGILHWKYMAEEALRFSGLDYTVIRATGLATAPAAPAEGSDGLEGTPPSKDHILRSKRRIEAAQGDSLSGRITRRELAEVVAASLDNAHSSGKTFEVRRDETESGKLVSTENDTNNWGVRYGSTYSGGQNFNTMFRGLQKDIDRSVSDGVSPCLPPFPCAQPPPSEPLPEERVQAILNDPRVKAAQERDEAANKGAVDEKGEE